jgi:Sec-independent protein translocase protein TatA
MPKLGAVEIIIILVIVFIIFGAGKLPQLFDVFGKKNKKAVNEELNETPKKKARV